MRIVVSGAAWRISAGQTSSSASRSTDPCKSAAVRPGGECAGGAKITVRKPGDRGDQRGGEAGCPAAAYGHVETIASPGIHVLKMVRDRGGGNRPGRSVSPQHVREARVHGLALAVPAGHEAQEAGAGPAHNESMRVEQRFPFAVHLLTSSGAALALLAMLAVADQHWRAAFIWLGIALIVDGIDGPIARRCRVRERLPKWDGAALDNVIDYTTYVFIPAVIAAKGLGLSAASGIFAGIVIAVSGALYYADTRMKQPDNSFRGFPVVWNMAVFVLYAVLPPPAVVVAVIILLAVVTFLPINFVHPIRVLRWRGTTLAALTLWLFAGGWLLATNFDAPLAVKMLLLVSSAYLACVSAVQQYLKPL